MEEIQISTCYGLNVIGGPLAQVFGHLVLFWKGCRTCRRWSLAGGSKSLGVELEVLFPTSCLLSAS